MNKKYVIFILLTIFFSSCRLINKKEEAIEITDRVKLAGDIDYQALKEELKEYLITKNITIGSINEMNGAKGIYELKNNQSTFYIDQNKNVFFGMIINLETGKNLTQTKLSNEDVSSEIINGNLMPVKMKVYKDGKDPNMFPQLKTPEDVDKLINQMEMSIKSFKELKNKMQGQL